MSLATQIYNFFSVQSALAAKPGQSVITPRCLGDFINENVEHLSIYHSLSGICNRLIDAGLMVSAGTQNGGSPPLNECYYSTPLNPRFIEYGICDFIAFGFPYIRNYFVNAVQAIVVKTMDEKCDIGTAFLHQSRCLITAAHCVNNMKDVRIHGWNPEAAPLADIFTKEDENCDLAVLQFNGDPFPNVPGFDLGQPEILDDVLVMGYPPIPGFQAPLTSETGQIAGRLQSTRGQVVASSKSYLDKQDYLLISARVKGGNSGGPVINRKGMVVGIVAGTPAGQNGDLDSLGYGAAVPANILRNLLSESYIETSKLRHIPFQMTSGGFKTIC